MPNAPAVMPFRYADSTRSLRHVFVRDLCLNAHIGIHKHEKGTAQPIRVNVDLAVLEETTRTHDKLDAVVCYEQVSNAIKDLVAQGHVNLVETLAEMIAQGCLEDERILTVRVRVEKLEAIKDAASVGVEIERSRPEARETGAPKGS